MMVKKYKVNYSTTYYVQANNANNKKEALEVAGNLFMYNLKRLIDCGGENLARTILNTFHPEVKDITRRGER